MKCMLKSSRMSRRNTADESSVGETAAVATPSYVGYFQMRDFIKRSPGRCGPLPSPFLFHYSVFKDCLWGQFYTCLRTVSQGARGAVKTSHPTCSQRNVPVGVMVTSNLPTNDGIIVCKVQATEHLGCRLGSSLHPKLSAQKSPAPASVASLDINNTAVHHKATGDPHE